MYLNNTNRLAIQVLNNQFVIRSPGHRGYKHSLEPIHCIIMPARSIIVTFNLSWNQAMRSSRASYEEPRWGDADPLAGVLGGIIPLVYIIPRPTAARLCGNLDDVVIYVRDELRKSFAGPGRKR